MKTFSSVVFTLFLLLGLIFSSACGGESVNTTPRGEEEMVSTTKTPTKGDLPEEETSSNEEATVEWSDQPYISPSDSFQITFPKGWNCSETGNFQVNCQSPDQSAEIQARITATGYELVQEAFLSFTHAELVHTYSEIKEYVETARNEEEGRLIVEANWRKGDTYWKGIDDFIRSGGAVLHLRAAVKKEFNNIYNDVFTQVVESVEIFPVKLFGADLYANRSTQTAPYAAFEIDIPTAWNMYEDAGAITRTVIEEFFSPDKRASVQIAVYQQGDFIEQTLKGEKTLEIMRTLYGHDLDVSHDKGLPDGRERLEWYAAKKDIHGISFFDSFGSTLYMFCIIWEETTADIYKPLLEEVSASFYLE